MEFKNKNIIISGATGGLGSELAIELAKLGANIFLFGRNEIKLKSLLRKLYSYISSNQNLEIICLDFSSKNIENDLKSTFSKLPSIDILINNAAIHGPIGNFWENDLLFWKNTFQVNFYCPFLLTRLAIPSMISNNKGKIINIAGGGATSSRPGFTSYAVSKTSLVRFTEIAADELKSHNIDINIVSPGAMPTNILKEVLKHNKKNISPDEIKSAKKVFKSGGSLSKAKNLCLFLASESSDGISGKLISAVWDPWNNLHKYKSKLNNSDIYTLRRIIPEERNESFTSETAYMSTPKTETLIGNSMKVSVVGLWHLGSITAACLADFGHQVTAIDKNKNLINDFKLGILPIYEPGLDELTKKNLKEGRITYSSNFSEIKNSDVVWITYDTPVDDDDDADVAFVETQIKDLMKFINPNGALIISSQMPIGTTSKLKNYATKKYPKYNIKFIYLPENLRLGNAINVFTNPDRVIVGVFEEESKDIIEILLNKIKNKIIWMSVPSAEMTKHAINSFLALSVTFINELSSFCELTGADASEVEIGLKSENRIGPKSYLKPGSAFSGGTLARDLKFLVTTANELNIDSTLLEAVLKSNDQHKYWIKNKLIKLFNNFNDIRITVLGLTYKPNTSTLRRSLSVELCNWLISENVEISVFDPKIKLPPKELKGKFIFFDNLSIELFKSDVIVISNECKEFLEIDFDLIYKTNPNLSIIDPNGFLNKPKINSLNKFNYYKIGNPK